VQDPFRQGIHNLGDGAWAYVQPDGSWGWNNAGLITDGDQSLLVDTLFDERLTAQMLRSLQQTVGVRGEEIDLLVNTHANGDHTFGNRLVEGARIIASRACAEEMSDMPPQVLAELMRQAPAMGTLGEYLLHCFSDFDFAGVSLREPDETFSGEHTLSVGDKQVHLIEVGPAHTAGDVLVHVPDNRVVYTGDILFIEGTPIMWQGPVGNWIRACDRILGMDVEVIVPGHGPLTDKQGVRRVQEYLRYIDGEARQRHAAGLSAEEAAKDIALGSYASWSDAERIAVNVDTLYREYRGDDSPPDVMRLFTLMAEVWRAQHSSRPNRGPLT
jgi:glyoxylase-like metal-dependent hydrolase (beta-lactamase superfamily II)